MRRAKGRRRGAFFSTALLPLLLLAAALALAAPRRSGGGSGGAVGTGTSSGAACVLTELGEEAVHAGDLILVNNWTPYRFPEEQELACIFDSKTASYYVRDREVYLAPRALTALNAMMDDFQAQGGSRTVNVVAGHRTAEFQQHLFDQDRKSVV